MAKEVKKTIMSQEDVMKLLDSCYEKCLDGIPKVSPNIEDFANEYLNKYKTPEIACKAMLRNQVTKCTTSGFITGFGGFLTMPVSIPANLTSVIYIQMRMIACTAYMAGYKLNSDETQTFVYACLAGVAVNGVMKKLATQFGQKVATNMIKKIPGTVLHKINGRVGFRFLTKFGSKGLINMGNLVPGVGAITNGAFDFVETRVIANRAHRWFFENDFSVDKGKNESEDDEEEIIIDLDDETILN